jgi:hypothetical protein
VRVQILPHLLEINTMNTILILALLAPSAPVPPPRPPKPLTEANIVGKWEMTWSTYGKWLVVFNKDNTYDCGGKTWVGNWTYKDGTLTVCETMPNSEIHSWTVWSIKVDNYSKDIIEGRLDERQRAKLVRQKK